ncbi:hypothetical protein DP117_32755 [Brasilonema sp. UFV-L1]|nr:hypothetical protein [Brasilonema sp. UFV-L1]
MQEVSVLDESRFKAPLFTMENKEKRSRWRVLPHRVSFTRQAAPKRDGQTSAQRLGSGASHD